MTFELEDEEDYLMSAQEILMQYFYELEQMDLEEAREELSGD